MEDFTSATNAIQAAKTIVSSNPVGAISGVATAITDTIKDTSKKVSSLFNSVENIFASVSGEEEATDVQLPMSNVLHSYATYSYLFGLYCLSPDSCNYPGSSYLAGKLPPAICMSASVNPNNRVKIGDNEIYEYYIEDLTIDAQTGFSSGTANTNIANIEFTVVEPYSMGMFIQAIQVAAMEAGYPNWCDSPYLLTVEFRGNTETGQLLSVPNTKKYIPIKFSKWNMKVTERGTVYSVSAYVLVSEAFNDHHTVLKTDVTIAGKTVQEILQSGPKSLQQVLNERNKQAKESNQVAVPDEILILFPTKIASEGASTMVAAEKEDPSKATTSPTSGTVEDLYKRLGVSRSSPSSILVQKAEDCNALGKATLGFDVNRGGSRPFPEDNAVWDDEKKIWERSNVCSAPGQTDFKFSQNSDIINAINQVMLKSQIAVDALKKEQISEDGFRPWWRVDTQVYYISSTANIKTTGTMPKLIVYRVIPYKVHASRMLPPNAATPGLDKLKDQIVKQYDFIYTGNNTDILRFDFEMNQAFYVPMAVDNGIKSGDVVTSQQNSGAAEVTVQDVKNINAKVPEGSDKGGPGVSTVQTKYDATSTSTDNKGGTRGGDTPATRAAKQFHDAVINAADMQNITIDIMGDPYYISTSGAGNYTDTQLKTINITKDGGINYQNGEVHFTVNFRTPTDIMQSTGMYDFKNTKLCHQFSGIYHLVKVKSAFKNGQFTQSLEGYRIQGQDSVEQASLDKLFSADNIPDINKGLNVEQFIKSASDTIHKTLDDLTPEFATDIKNGLEKTISTANKIITGGR